MSDVIRRTSKFCQFVAKYFKWMDWNFAKYHSLTFLLLVKNLIKKKRDYNNITGDFLAFLQSQQFSKIPSLGKLFRASSSYFLCRMGKNIKYLPLDVRSRFKARAFFLDLFFSIHFFFCKASSSFGTVTLQDLLDRQSRSRRRLRERSHVSSQRTGRWFWVRG